jgi:flavin prenyltransferase
MAAPRRLIVGITGATGIVYGVRLLELLRETGIETHLVVSRAGDLTRAHELDLSAKELRALASVSHPAADLGAAISSGSFRTMGMVVAPCSVRSLAEIASGVTTNLLTRAADVVLKERRRLVLLVRETPLHAGHLKNMLAATEAGAVVMPPVPAFYGRPRSIDEMVTDTVCRALDLFDLDVGRLKRWGEGIPTRPARGGEDGGPA